MIIDTDMSNFEFNMNNFLIAFVISIVFIGVFILIYKSIEKSKDKHNAEAVSTVKENFNSTEEIVVSVTSNEALNEIIKEINSQNKKIIEIFARTDGDGFRINLLIK